MPRTIHRLVCAWRGEVTNDSQRIQAELDTARADLEKSNSAAAVAEQNYQKMQVCVMLVVMVISDVQYTGGTHKYQS